MDEPTTPTLLDKCLRIAQQYGRHDYFPSIDQLRMDSESFDWLEVTENKAVRTFAFTRLTENMTRRLQVLVGRSYVLSVKFGNAKPEIHIVTSVESKGTSIFVKTEDKSQVKEMLDIEDFFGIDRAPYSFIDPRGLGLWHALWTLWINVNLREVLMGTSPRVGNPALQRFEKHALYEPRVWWKIFRLATKTIFIQKFAVMNGSPLKAVVSECHCIYCERMQEVFFGTQLFARTLLQQH